MIPSALTTAAIWGIVAATIAGILLRPWQLPEAFWAVSGALLACLPGLLPWHEALLATHKGLDVYLFLAGMMIASELARQEGVFDYFAGLAAHHANGSAPRLFLLVYGVGVVITIFMSNDATAVVLTPAVLAITRAVKTDRPLPYLYACAFVANAASFVLPISNPANLVIFQDRMPSLGRWLAHFTLPSILSIAATYLLLRLAHRSALRQAVAMPDHTPTLGRTGKYTACGIVLMAAVMLTASARGMPLGLPTFIAGLAVFFAVSVQKRHFPVHYLKDISWSVLPLVAGLFVLVQALDRTGMILHLAGLLRSLAHLSLAGQVWISSLMVAISSNIANNLPVGLLAGKVLGAAHAPVATTSAVLIGVDLGPNLSVSGSLATLLWLAALRREGVKVDALAFLKIGAVTMLPALLAALAALHVAARLSTQ